MDLNPFDKLSFPNGKGMNFVNLDDIVHCKSDGNYTTIYLRDKSHLVVCRKLGHLETVLPASAFIRVHHSHMVRWACVVNYLHKSSELLMTNGQRVPVSRRKKKELMSRFTPV